MIACVHVAHFAAEVERGAQSLPDATPLVLARGTQVGAVCAAAAAHGVRPGMTLRHARALSPAAQIYPLAPGRSREAADDLLELLATFSGRVEAEPPAERTGAALWFLDLGAVDALAAADLAALIARALAERARLQGAIGIAGTRFTARCAAAEATPGRPEYVRPGDEAAFLATLPIAYLPLDAALHERLDLLGLRRIGQLAALPASALLTQFGALGRLLGALAHGRDVDPIQPYIPAAALGLTRRFDGPVADSHALRLALQTLGARLAIRLERRGCAAREVRLHLEQPDVAPWIDALVLDAPTAQADVLQRALAQLLARAQLAGGVEHLRAGCADLRPVVATQLDLFGSRAALERDALVANLVARFGARRFFAAVPQQRDAVLPERRYELLEARRR